MTWLNPDWFLWLLLIPFGALIYILRSLQREKNLSLWFDRQKFFLTGRRSLWIRHLKTALAFSALTLFILALARPQTEGEKTKKESAGIQIVLAVDVSRSMTAEDIYPNRLEFLKKELSRFLNMSGGDQAALAAFSGSALLISPFTTDLSLINVYLDDLSPDFLSAQGTDFNKLFKVINRIFKNVSENTKKRIVRAAIIASDGEDHASGWKSGIKLLKDQGVRVFTLSVGTKEGGVIPLKNAKGEVVEYKKDSSGKVVISRLKSKSLKQIASKARGGYYHLSYSGRAIEKLRKDLDRLKKTVFETGEFYTKKELFQWFLAVGLILALLELLLIEWRQTNKT